MKIAQFFGCVAGSALAVCQASANLIINGDFESGNTGFTSDYEYTSASGGLATGGEGSGAGRYAVGTNPQYYHSSFSSAGDHTSGSGQMMIVNGSLQQNPIKNVWTGSLVGPLTVGATYQLTAWVMNVYSENPASLSFSVGGTQVGSNFSATGVGVWQQFTASFVATANQTPTAVDLKLQFSGDDFALDDISLAPVPEPTTFFAGALLLLPFAASALRYVRRPRTA